MAEDILTAILTTNNTRERIAQYRSEHDPEIRLKEAGKEIDDILNLESAALASLNNFKAVTINEFDNGVLMCDTLPDQFRTFAIEMMRQLQQEYQCQTTSERAICELATVAFVRTLEFKQLMWESTKLQDSLGYAHTCGQDSSFSGKRACLACNKLKFELQRYPQLGIELDRANRQYLSAIQTLRMMKQAPLNVTIKAQTAIVGQNQMIQSYNHE